MREEHTLFECRKTSGIAAIQFRMTAVGGVPFRTTRSVKQ